VKKDNLKRPKIHMVHVRLTEELQKRLRIRAAENDTTLQDWVAIAIENELDRQNHKKGKGGCLKENTRLADNAGTSDEERSVC